MAKDPAPREVIRSAFPGITSIEAEEMVTLGDVKTYPGQTVLCQEDSLESTFYILLAGEVEVTKRINDADAKILKYLQPGDFFGEMALINNAPRAATVTTVGEAAVLEINRENFQHLLSRNTAIALAMVREVSRRLRENDAMAIGDLRMKARELADAYQQLAELDYARREFLTTIAHELRTPLTAASGFLQMIRLGYIEGEALNTALETVTRNLQEIITLMNDILFLQEMDLILLDFQPTDIGRLVASVVEQQRGRASQNQVGLNLNIRPGLPAVTADQKSLERAVNAIINNAIKFSPDGGEVQIHVVQIDQQVCVQICDQGVGIPSEYIGRIFDRFFHLDDINGKLFRGVGLGLSIARQVVEQHGGVIEVHSELGKGSQFTVRLWVDGKHT